VSEESEESGDKPHDPTLRKLEEARKRGDIPRSPDLTTAAGYLGFVAAFLAFGADSVERLGTTLRSLIGQPDRMADLFFHGASAPMGGLLPALAIGLAPWFALPALFAILAILAQRGFAFTGENLAPKLSRISPMALAAQKFGGAGLFEFAKNTVKLILVSLVLGFFLSGEAEAILALLMLAPSPASAELARILGGFLMAVVAVSLTLGALDYFWQYFEHIKRNRMSLKELRDEAKESEGDPHFKHERRRRGIDIATNRMLADVPKADVVIVNPTHYAVALKWSRKKGTAPECVAKGVDEIAARIREAAAEAGVPIHRDPPTARALHASVEIGREIRPEHYKAAAAAIRFAERMRAKAKTRAGR
jgi:flagellar biosynthetic protein FlhB